MLVEAFRRRDRDAVGVRYRTRQNGAEAQEGCRGDLTPPAGQVSIWQLDKFADYYFRTFSMMVAGTIAGITIFLMEVPLILQKVIVILSGP
jgi:hypothetical protein